MLRSIRVAVCAMILVQAPLSAAFAAEAAPQPMPQSNAKPAPTAKAQVCTHRYVEALNMEATMKASSAAMLDAMKGMTSPLTDPKEKARFDAMMGRVMTEVMDDLTPKIVADMIPAMTEVFDETEICAMADFYGTPTGQSIIAKMPALMSVSMQSVSKYMPELQQRMMRAFCRELDCTGTALEGALKAS